MITLDVRANIRQAQAFLIATQQGTARATARALNRTATTVQAEAARLIQDKRALNISTIKKSMKIERATTRRLIAVVTVRGKSISIRNFSRLNFDRINGKNVGIRSVSVKIEKGKRAYLLKKYGNKAFTSPAIGGGLPIVVRRGKKRYPIEAIPAVPGLPRVFVQEHIAEALKRVARTTFEKRIAAELNYEINVAKRKAA